MSNFMKIHPVGVELFHADGETDMTKLIVAFRNFANAPKTTNWNYRKTLLKYYLDKCATDTPQGK